MSRIFGPVIQQGYIVPDVREAAKHWNAIGVGPFFIDDGLTLEGEYYGETHTFGLTPAFSYSGDQQIELIQPDGDGPSIYKDYLKQVPEGGLQHIAVWAEEPDAFAAKLKADGHDFIIPQSYYDGTKPGTRENRHMYLDSKEFPGTMVQLMMRDDLYIKLFGMIHDGAESWDGSDPIRPLRPLLEKVL